jgi:alpha-tubulin suppressor-like RCC1 family protein
VGWGAIPGTAVSLQPVAVAPGIAFAQLSAGYAHVCGVTTAKLIYCWGDNAADQLGVQRVASATPTAPLRPRMR